VQVCLLYRCVDCAGVLIVQVSGRERRSSTVSEGCRCQSHFLVCVVVTELKTATFCSVALCCVVIVDRDSLADRHIKHARLIRHTSTREARTEPGIVYITLQYIVVP